MVMSFSFRDTTGSTNIGFTAAEASTYRRSDNVGDGLRTSLVQP